MRRHLLASIVAALAFVQAPGTAIGQAADTTGTASPPNIVIILADDK